MPLIALLPAAAFALSGLVLAAHQQPLAAGETRYLCLLATLVLAGGGLLAPRRSRLAAGGALLLAVALWALPAGLPRAATFSVLLPAVLLGALWEQARARSSRLVAVAGAVLASGALLRGPELLPAGLDATAIASLTWPAVVAALALGWWEHRCAGTGVAMAVAVALAGGGFTALAVVALVVALALALLPPRLSLAVATLLLVAALVVRHDAASLRALWPLFVLVPLAWVPFGGATTGGEHAVRLARALLVGAAGVAAFGPPGIAGGVALLVLGERAREDAVADGTAPLARAARSVLLALAAISAAYPWLRPHPLEAGLALLGLRRGWIAAAVVLAIALLVVAATWVAPRLRRVAALVVSLGATCALLVAMPATAREVLPATGVALTAAAPAFAAPIAGARLPRELRVVTTLAQSAMLPPDTRVAAVTLLAGARPLARWDLRVGDETAEWAARRADLRGAVAAAPLAWAWLPPGAEFFAQAYAARWRPALPSSPAAARSPLVLRLERDPALPAAVRVSVLRLQVAP